MENLFQNLELDEPLGVNEFNDIDYTENDEILLETESNEKINFENKENSNLNKISSTNDENEVERKMSKKEFFELLNKIEDFLGGNHKIKNSEYILLKDVKDFFKRKRIEEIKEKELKASFSKKDKKIFLFLLFAKISLRTETGK